MFQTGIFGEFHSFPSPLLTPLLEMCCWQQRFYTASKLFDVSATATPNVTPGGKHQQRQHLAGDNGAFSSIRDCSQDQKGER